MKNKLSQTQFKFLNKEKIEPKILRWTHFYVLSKYHQVNQSEFRINLRDNIL